MTPSRLTAQKSLSLAFGVAMVAATVSQTHGLTLWTAGLAFVAVLFGVRFRSAATLATVLTALTLALSAPVPMLAVMSGLCATAYLVVRHGRGTNSVTPTKSTVLAALIFGLVGAVVTAFPLDMAWLPLIAPFGLLGAFAIAAHPYMRHPNQN